MRDYITEILSAHALQKTARRLLNENPAKRSRQCALLHVTKYLVELEQLKLSEEK